MIQRSHLIPSSRYRITINFDASPVETDWSSYSRVYITPPTGGRLCVLHGRKDDQDKWYAGAVADCDCVGRLMQMNRTVDSKSSGRLRSRKLVEWCPNQGSILLVLCKGTAGRSRLVQNAQ